MVNVFKKKMVWEEKISIPIKKFLKGLLYTIAITGVSFIIEAFSTGNVPQDWIIYSGIVIAMMQAIKKGLEEYDPMKDR